MNKRAQVWFTTLLCLFIGSLFWNLGTLRGIPKAVVVTKTVKETVYLPVPKPPIVLVEKPRHTWWIGDTVETVRKIQGAPKRIVVDSAQTTWYYYSYHYNPQKAHMPILEDVPSDMITFTDGKVADYANRLGTLKVR